MNEQKVREAIEELKSFVHVRKLVLETLSNYARKKSYINREIMAIEIAIETLKKQLRLKPIRVCDKESMDYQCPVCGTVLMSMYPGYEYGEKTDCCKCRQAIDWSE